MGSILLALLVCGYLAQLGTSIRHISSVYYLLDHVFYWPVRICLCQLTCIMKFVTLLVAAVKAVSALTIAEINGNHYSSAYDGQDVKNVTGLITAIGGNGLFLRSLEPDNDAATGEALFVFTNKQKLPVKVGDVVSMDGHIELYRSNKNYIYIRELSKPANIVVRSSGNTFSPLVIGVDTLSPPTEDFSSLDEGGIFGVPNAVNRISEVNPQLNVTSYGLDFWQSLVGEYVTVKNAFLTSRPNRFGDVWVRGDWKVTGINGHGGVTMLDGGEYFVPAANLCSSCVLTVFRRQPRDHHHRSSSRRIQQSQ